EFTINKRLSHRWMSRVNFAWSDWKEHFEGTAGIQNPTATDINGVFQGGGPSRFCGPCADGGQVYLKSYGAKTNTFANAKWNGSATGLYQLGAGFETSAAILARQGYPKVEIIQTGTGADGSRRVLPVGGADRARYDNFYNLDLRLAKELKLAGNASLNLAVDLFNVFNSDTVLQETRRINSNAYRNILEIPNPRSLPFALALQFQAP